MTKRIPRRRPKPARTLQHPIPIIALSVVKPAQSLTLPKGDESFLLAMGENEPEPNVPKTQAKLDGGPPRPPKLTARDLEDGSPDDESVLDEIARRMARYPSARVQRMRDSIAYIPNDPNGFIVRLKVRSQVTRQGVVEEYFVAYDKCVARFALRDDAVTQFGFGLCTSCRLCERWCAGRPYHQSAELLRSAKMGFWGPDPWVRPWTTWTTSFCTLWLPGSVRYLQNDLIDVGEAGVAQAA